MTYFSKFPLMVYEFKGKQSVVKDILRRAAFVSEYKPYTDLYTPYSIVDGDTPQSLANSFYGASTYHWVILMFGEIHNPYFEWPLGAYDLVNYCTQKYGINMYMTRHYELNDIVVGQIKEFSKDVAWVPPDPVGLAVPISFYDYESRINDDKRVISIMRPELLGDFVTQFQDAINV